jgi:hypothetical protein
MNIAFDNPRAARALSLYRQIIRQSKIWPGSQEDRSYILNEARDLFHKNRDITDAATIDAKLFEAESRIGLATHYGIPYPRPYMVPPPKSHMKRVVPAYMHSHVNPIEQKGSQKPTVPKNEF